MQRFFKNTNSREAITSVGWGFSLMGLWGYSFKQMLFNSNYPTTSQANNESEQTDISYPRYD